MASEPKHVVLISGCSSGIGLATAVHLAQDPEQRFKVYATMRNLKKKDKLEEIGAECLNKTLFIKQMDVSSDESVEKAVKEIQEADKRIDVLCEYWSHLMQKSFNAVCMSIFKFWAPASVAWIHWNVQKGAFPVGEISLSINCSVLLRKRSDVIPTIVFVNFFSFVQMSLLIKSTSVTNIV